MDTFAAIVNRLRGKGRGQFLKFTGCCAEHDLFYEQGGTSRDRAFADKVFRLCIAENLQKRGKSKWVQLHVPVLFWVAVRAVGWLFWAKA